MTETMGDKYEQGDLRYIQNTNVFARARKAIEKMQMNSDKTVMDLFNDGFINVEDVQLLFGIVALYMYPMDKFPVVYNTYQAFLKNQEKVAKLKETNRKVAQKLWN